MRNNVKSPKKQRPKKQKEPDANVLAENCPSRKIMTGLTSKWSVLIFIALGDGSTKRFSELRRVIEGVSEKMLTQTLKSLEENNLVFRKSYHVVPPYVEYSLTNLGMEAASKLNPLSTWIEDNIDRF